MGKEKVEQTQHGENNELEEKETPHVNYLRPTYLHRQWTNAMAHKTQGNGIASTRPGGDAPLAKALVFPLALKWAMET